MAANTSSGVVYENSHGCKKVLDVGTRSMAISETPSECGKDKMRVRPASCVLLVCLGILCALLVGGIIWVSVEMTKYETSLGNKETEVKNLQDENQQLGRERDDLNMTLGVMLTFNNFPVNNNCPNNTCQMCQNGWILFQGNCYRFFNLTVWVSWTESRQFCQRQSADLVVINNLEEQMFISNHSEYYYDQWHGYWLGLQQINTIWTWVDGHVDTLGYWISQPYGSSWPFAVLLPRPHDHVPPVTKNWGSSYYWYQSRFICERKSLIILN